MYPNIKSPTGGGATPAPDWRTNLPDALKEKVPEGANGVTRDGNIYIFTKDGTAIDGGKYNSDGSKYDPTKSANANPEVRTPSGTTPAGNGGRTGGTGNGSSSSLFNMGFSNNTSGDLSAKFVNGNYDIDAQKFMGAAMGFGAMSSLAQMMPFGLGAVFANNAIGATLNNFMKSVSFNFDFSSFNTSSSSSTTTTSGSDNDNEGATTTSGTGEKSVADIARDRGYTATDTDGVYKNNGKFFKYDEKTKEFVECKADGSALTEEQTAQPSGTSGSSSTSGGSGTAETPSATHTTTSKKTKGTSSAQAPAHTQQAKPKAKTEAELAKEGGYVKLTNGKYKKNGQIYEYKNGKFTYFADQTYTDGKFIKSGRMYNEDGTLSKTTNAFGNSPAMHTITYYQQDGNEYTQGSYQGLTTLTSKDGKVTRYFDSAGRLVQTNEKDNGGLFSDYKNSVTRYTYGNRTGALSKKVTSNIATNTTTTVEYNLSGLKAGKTVQRGPVQTEQQMDSQGRVSTFKYQATTTVEVVNDRGKQKRITTVVKNQVR